MWTTIFTSLTANYLMSLLTTSIVVLIYANENNFCTFPISSPKFCFKNEKRKSLLSSYQRVLGQIKSLTPISIWSIKIFFSFPSHGKKFALACFRPILKLLFKKRPLHQILFHKIILLIIFILLYLKMYNLWTKQDHQREKL